MGCAGVFCVCGSVRFRVVLYFKMNTVSVDEMKREAISSDSPHGPIISFKVYRCLKKSWF